MTKHVLRIFDAPTISESHRRMMVSRLSSGNSLNNHSPNDIPHDSQFAKVLAVKAGLTEVEAIQNGLGGWMCRSVVLYPPKKGVQNSQ